MIHIYDIDGKSLLQAELTEGAVREEELSKSDYVQLTFVHGEKITLPVGAYIKINYRINDIDNTTEKFSLLEPYEPTQSDELSWKYSPQFQHPKMALGKIPFYISTKNSKNELVHQTNWSFYGSPQTIMERICNFLNKEVKFGNCGWTSTIVGVLENTLNVSFNDVDVLSALSSVSNALDNVEWHIDYDHEVIYLGKIVIGESSQILKVGENVGSVSITDSKEKYYNRFTIWGGSRNISQVNSQGDNISSGDIRLQLQAGMTGSIQLPNGQIRRYTTDDFSTIDMREDNEMPLTKVVEHSDIFPSMNTYVYNVRGREKYVLDSTTNEKIPILYNSDGSVAKYKTFTVWYMRLAYKTTNKEEGKTLVNTTIEQENGKDIICYWYDFEITDKLVISGKTLSCSFEANYSKGALTTPLAGRGENGDNVGFELVYHKYTEKSRNGDDVSEYPFEILAGDYEIIYQQSNGFIIPSNLSDGIVPKGEDFPTSQCNVTVIYNIAMDNIYISLAQESLLKKGIEDIGLLYSDRNNYTFKAIPSEFYKKNILLRIGQKVTYDDGVGYALATRVIKLTTHIDYPCEQEITVGNQVIKGSITQLKEDVQSIIASSGDNGNGSALTVEQFKNQLRRFGGLYFLSKLNDDTAQNIITFLQRQIFRNGFTLGEDSTPYGIDEGGSATLSSVAADRVHDTKSTENDRVLTGAQGYDIYMGTDGKSYGYIDNLIVRQKALFASMEIRKVSYAGGSVLYSNAGSTIVKVAYIFDTAGKVTAVKCYAKADDGTTKTMNWWRVGMMALCQTYNIGGNGNRYYWRLVVGVGQEPLDDGMTYDYVVLSNIQTFKGTDAVIPNYGERVLGNKDGNAFGWGDGNIAIAITTEETSTTMAASSGADKDDAGTAIGDKTFYGYDPSVGNDLPTVGDVIVQAGDQIRWKSRGNMVAIRTSSEDEGADSVPSITMYHSMGAPYSTGSKDADGNDIANPYQWKKKTSVQSPEQWLVNAGNFKFFTDDDESKIVEPIATTYEIASSSDTLTVHADNSTTPTDFTLSLAKHYGNSTTEVTDAKIYARVYNGPGVDDSYFEYGNALWPFFPATMYAAKGITFEAYDKAGKEGGNLLASKNIPILRDGSDGKSVSIKGSLASKDALPSSGAVSGDGYIINGDLWSYSGTTKEDDSNHNGFTNVGKIQGPSGKDATQYYIYTAWMNTADNSDNSFTTSNPQGSAYKYLGTCISTEKIQPSTYGSYKWSLIKGDDGSSVTMNGKATDAFTDGTLPDGTNVFSWEDVVASGLVSTKAGDIYLFWLADGAGSRAQVVTYETDSRYNIKDAPVGASYVVDNTQSIMGVDGHLYSCNGDSAYTEWRDMGLWRGRDGVVITATPGNIVFNTGTDGLVDMSKQANVKVRLTALRGSEELPLDITSVTGHGCKAEYANKSVVFASIDTEDITLSDGTKKTLSVGGGYVLVSCLIDGVTYNTNVGFSVNVSAYASKVEWDATQYDSTFTEYTKTNDDRVAKAESSIRQNADNISLKVSKDDLKPTGIDIDARTITLTADTTYIKNRDGEQVAVFNSDGSLIAGSLKTADTGYGSVAVKDGEIGIYNPNGLRNIRFGLSGDGYMVLQYFDNDGNLLYDLGPSGLTQSSVRGQSWYEGEYVRLVSGTDYVRQCLWSNGTWQDTAPTGGSLYGTWYTKAIGSLTEAAFTDITDLIGQTKPPTGTQPRWDDNGYTGVKLYKYYAAKLNGTALADTAAGLTPAEAALADGRWFTQKTELGDGSGNIQHTAKGYFMPYAGKVADGVSVTGGYYPAYRLTGMMEILWGSQTDALTVVSEAVLKSSVITAK